MEEELHARHPPEPREDLPGKPVQKEVHYSRRRRLAVFDLCVNGMFVTQNWLRKLCSDAQLPMPPLLWTGPASAMVTYLNDKNSDVPPQATMLRSVDVRRDFVTQQPLELGLPSLPDNISEGVIVRTLEGDASLFVGSSVSVPRKLFKLKTSKFREIVRSNGKKAPPGGDAVAFLCAEARAYVTEARLWNAASHIGVLDETTRKEILVELATDALNAMREDHAEQFDALSSKQKMKKVEGAAFDQARCLIAAILAANEKEAPQEERPTKEEPLLPQEDLPTNEEPLLPQEDLASHKQGEEAIALRRALPVVLVSCFVALGSVVAAIL